MWRQVDYNRLLENPSYLARWFLRRFRLRFAHAEKGSVRRRYHLKLTTIIAEAGLSNYKRLSEAHSYVCRTLDSLDQIIERYDVTKKFEAGLT